MARVIISGSLAYDTLMAFGDKFKNHIMPDRMHILNVCFQVAGLRREFGGTAGNIAYNLKLLGQEPVIFGAAGRDFGAYKKRLMELSVDIKNVYEDEELYTAQAFITTDVDNNQIIAFHPGAMGVAHKVAISGGADIGIVSPNGKRAMTLHAAQLAAAGIAFMFDPGQGLAMFNGDELREFLRIAKWVVVNDYESGLLREKCELSDVEIANLVDAYIITRGAGGADIFSGGDKLHIDAVVPTDIFGDEGMAEAGYDPTGCGDAFRAGVLYGLVNKFGWRVCGRLGVLMAGIKLNAKGTQNHTADVSQVKEFYGEIFGGGF